ncbi:hypothetical protein [Streptomyces lydicus]|uniref:hypothetical protein n=1 Tax=Streptomyces lydicus TaxID=47763 RepID=UPI0037B65695
MGASRSHPSVAGDRSPVRPLPTRGLGTLISVDNSQHAVPIERLLERAINHLPVLIADTITEVST